MICHLSRFRAAQVIDKQAAIRDGSGVVGSVTDTHRNCSCPCPPSLVVFMIIMTGSNTACLLHSGSALFMPQHVVDNNPEYIMDHYKVDIRTAASLTHATANPPPRHCVALMPLIAFAIVCVLSTRHCSSTMRRTSFWATVTSARPW